MNASFAEACGGGASYATKGTAGSDVQCGTSGAAGDVYGEAELLNDISHGSGGGSGQPWKVGSGGAGGDGGGQVIINARIFENHGIIEANGGNGEDGSFYSGGGGGGSGGAILLRGSSFKNHGSITARGGFGGFRSVDSGSGHGEEEPFVRGGNGGNGRIRIDYLSKFSFGQTIPAPYNTTLWDGAVYWYKKNVSNDGLYDFITDLPRAPAMQFIGHSVAIRDSTVAIASDERTLKNPRQVVYLVDLSGVESNASSYTRYSELAPPGLYDDLGFGYETMHFDFNNTSIMISANGANLTRGVSYIYVGSDLFNKTDRIDTLEAEPIANFTSNEFGVGAAYKYPYVITRVPTSSDIYLNHSANERESQGTVIIMRHFSNISAAHSSIDCEYTAATVNTTLTCHIRTFDVLGRPVGDVHHPFHT